MIRMLQHNMMCCSGWPHSVITEQKVLFEKGLCMVGPLLHGGIMEIAYLLLS